MAKKAVSVTLETDNILWLKSRVRAAGGRSVSELVDRLITQARSSGSHQPGRSVVGTVDIDPGDPWLEQVDAAVKTIFDRSLGRPSLVKESKAPYAAARPKPRRRG